jgi:hypothetical protein
LDKVRIQQICLAFDVQCLTSEPEISRTHKTYYSEAKDVVSMFSQEDDRSGAPSSPAVKDPVEPMLEFDIEISFELASLPKTPNFLKPTSRGEYQGATS